MNWTGFLSAIGVKKGVKWQRYYWRVIGYFLVFGGGGLLIDEMITGAFNMTQIGHEWLGIILMIVGGFCISRKPKGKENDA